MPPTRFTGQESNGQITSMAMDGNYVWVAAGSHVLQFLRGKEVGHRDISQLSSNVRVPG